jgi:predicted ABC-class ATPase
MPASISIQFQNNDEFKIYHFGNIRSVPPKINDDNVILYYEEVVRLMNEMIVLLKESNTLLKQHIRTVEELNERVRRIGINTNSLR